MQLKYVDTKEEIIAINRKSKHIEPHLHNALEIVCVALYFQMLFITIRY